MSVSLSKSSVNDNRNREQVPVPGAINGKNVHAIDGRRPQAVGVEQPACRRAISARRCVSRAGLAQRIRYGRKDESRGYQERLSIDRHREGVVLRFVFEAEPQVPYRGFTGEGAARSIRALLEAVAAAAARGPEPLEHRGRHLTEDDGLRHGIFSAFMIESSSSPDHQGYRPVGPCATEALGAAPPYCDARLLRAKL